MNFSYKLFIGDRLIDKCFTHSKRRFLKKLRTINWEVGHFKVYLRIGYGKLLDYYGKLSNFYNEGEYNNKNDFWLAFEAFIEKENNNVIS